MPSPSLPAQSTAQSFILDFYSFGGSADLYVDINQPNRGPASTFLLVANSGPNQLVLSALDTRVSSQCVVGAPCWLSIGAVWASSGPGSGTGPVYYTITGTPNTATINITDGSPLTRTVSGGGSALFAYMPLTASNVTFALTVFSGSAAVFVSTATPTPSAAASTWQIPYSQEGGVLTIYANATSDYAPTVPPYPIFYLAVYGAANNASTTFSISAMTAPGKPYSLPLNDGEAQVGSSPAHSFSYYTLNYTSAAMLAVRTLDVYAALAAAGSVAQVYINPVPFGSLAPVYPQPQCKLVDPTSQVCSQWGANSSTYMYSSENSAAPGYVSVLQPSGTLLPSSFIVGVMAVSPDFSRNGNVYPAGPSTYTLTASSGVYLTQLQVGASFPGTVRRTNPAAPPPFTPQPQGSIKYYAFLPPQPNADIVVNVEVGGGSLEVYAVAYSTQSAPEPSAFNAGALPGPAYAGYASTWNSTAQAGTSQRSRYLRITYADFINNAPSGCAFSIVLGLRLCGLAIGVWGNPQLLGSASFAVTASQSGSPLAPLLLRQGTTEYLALPPNGCAYVSGIPDGTTRYQGSTDYIYAANQVGTATMYVNYGSDKQFFYQPGQGMIPDGVFTDEGGSELAALDGFDGSHNIYITLCAPSSGGSEHLITYRSNFGVQSLDDSARVRGESQCRPNRDGTAVQCFPAVFSFAVTDNSATVSFTVDRDQGSVQAYISKAVPGQPWVLPGPPPLYSDWSFYPTFFSPTFSITTADTKRCPASPDTPCLYYIALLGSEQQPATFYITASATALSMVTLYDGQPTSGSVLDGSINYYSFRPSAAGIPPPAVNFMWSNLFGAVGLYITNNYYPGVSQASILPGPTSAAPCQWVCTNWTGCSASPGDACYTPTGYNGAAVVYTVGVLGMSDSNFTSGALFNNEYAITAVNAGDPIALTIGLPMTDIVLFPYTNTTFVFELDGERTVYYDVLISASVNHGSVIMLVAPAFGVGLGAGNPPPPQCVVPAFGGTRLSCTGAVWQATSGYGDSVVYLSADYSGPGVCAPVVPAGTIAPVTNSSLCLTYFPPTTGPTGPSRLRRGKYYVTLYTQVISELSLLVQVAGIDQTDGQNGRPPVRPVPRTILADGQPLYLQTGPMTMCPGQLRDNVTEHCPPSAPSYTASGSMTIFRVPSGTPMTFLNVVVERLCGGNTTADCGPEELFIAVNGCAPDNCTANILTPYLADAYFNYTMSGAVAGFRIPFEACYAQCYTPLPNLAPDCIYAIGVFPSVSGGTPGVGMNAQTFRITLATPIGTQRIAQDCPGNGRYCTLPTQFVAPQQSRVYESYASSNGAAVSVSLGAQLCYGTGLSLYVCVPGLASGTACSQQNSPSSVNRNYDFMGTADTNGYVRPITAPAGTLFKAPGDIYFFALTAPGIPGAAPPNNAVGYELALQHDSGLVFSIGASTMSAAWDPTSTFLSVSWTMPTLIYSGTGVSYPLASVGFELHTFLLGSAIPPFQPATPCGLDILSRSNVTGYSSTRFQQAVICGTGTDPNLCTAVLTPPTTIYSYQIGLSALCANIPLPGSSGRCMPWGETQRIAWPTIIDNPAPVPISPSGTASNSPSPSAAAQPSAGPLPNNIPPPAKPSVAGPVVGSLLGLALLGGLGYAAFHYGWFSAGGAASIAYTKLSTLISGGEARASSSAAREALTAHPIFSASAGGGAGGEADYAPLA